MPRGLRSAPLAAAPAPAPGRFPTPLTLPRSAGGRTQTTPVPRGTEPGRGLPAPPTEG